MANRPVPRKLAAILAADVAGFTRLVGIDEEGTLAELDAIRRQIIDPAIEACGARMVKTMGDGFLIEFPSVVHAVTSAVDMQEQLAQRNEDRPADRRIELRIGINLGDIVVQGDDILGDGVNIASRLETIADPGSIYMSGAAHEQVHSRSELAFEFLGEQKLRNVNRPIAVYVARRSTGEATAAPVRKLALPDKPSIAVLPFDNMSEEADYFADGITEDIITELSRFSELFVIARNSTFTYKGRPVKVQLVRDELGVRYVVEGSIRRMGDRVRINVQLIDSESGSHVWADRFDRPLDQIYEVQDELIQAVVATISGRVDAAEKGRIRRNPPDPMAALDYVLAGRIHHHRVTAEDNAEAIRLLNKAIELSPNYAEAHAWKGCTIGQALQFGYVENAKEMEQEAMGAVMRALSLDENNVECHRLLCEVYMQARQIEKAKVHSDRAYGQNPNDPRLVAQQGELRVWQGESEAGEALIRQAMRLDPNSSAGRVHLLGYALFTAGRYREALDAFRQVGRSNYVIQLFGAACLAMLGEKEDAAREVENALEQKPGFSIAAATAALPYTNPRDREHLIEALRLAGLPE